MDLFESVIDMTRKSLDPAIFDKDCDQYLMKPEVVNFLQSVIDKIDDDITHVINHFIKGSILSFQWNDKTDIDLLIETNRISENDRRRIQDIIDERFSINIPGTEHPLQIYINSGKYDLENADGIYDLNKGWIKGPYNIAANVDDYMSKFRKTVGSVDTSTGELKRDLIDYDMLKELPTDDVDGIEKKIEEKLEEIDGDVEDLVFQYKHIRNMRHDAFKEDMTPEDLAKYGTKNALPENVIFKLLERYYYLEFMRELKNLIDNNNDIDTEEEIDQVKNILRDKDD
jgi:hypothetical protein